MKVLVRGLGVLFAIGFAFLCSAGFIESNAQWHARTGDFARAADISYTANACGFFGLSLIAICVLCACGYVIWEETR